MAVAAGDFNRDGHDDLFLVTEIERPSLVFGVLGPEFLPSVEHQIRFYILSGRWEASEEPRLVDTLGVPGQVLLGVQKPIVADFDKDGYLDVVVLLTTSAIPEPPALVDFENLDNHLLVFWGQGDGTFVRTRVPLEVVPIPGDDSASLISIGDFDSDGQVDIACLDPRNLRLQVFYNKGRRSFAGPYYVSLGRTDDACIPVAMNLRAAWVDETKPGDDIVVSGPCYHAEDSFSHFIRVISPCGTDCWSVSPLLLTDVQVPSFLDALWDIAVTDVNGDKHADVLLLGLAHIAEAETQVPGVASPAMSIYLLSGNGRGQFAPPLTIGWSEKGRFLSVDAQLDGEWSTVIVVLTGIGGRAWARVVRTTHDFSQASSATLHGRGYVVDGAVVYRGTSRELVLLASLDLESEVTLVNVVRGW
jgi:hypothetical protein